MNTAVVLEVVVPSSRWSPTHLPASEQGRARVAANERTAAEVLAALAGADERVVEPIATPYVRKKVAYNSSCPSWLLTVLARDADIGVRYAVARHAALSHDMLPTLAHDDVAAVRAAIAQRADCPVDLLAELSTDDAAKVRTAVGWNVNSSTETLLRLAAADELAEVRRGAVARLAQRESPEAVALLVSSENERDRRRAAKRADLTDEQMRALVGDSDVWVVVNLVEAARSTPRPEWVFIEAAKHSNPIVGERLAALTCHLPVEAVRHLAETGNVAARAMLARQTQTPVSVLTVLAAGRSRAVIGALLDRVEVDGVPPGVWMARHPEQRVRVNAARALPVTSPLFVELASDASVKVRSEVAVTFRLPSQCYDVLVVDPSVAVRRKVAENPSLSAQHLHVLSADADVRTAQVAVGRVLGAMART